MTEMFRRSAAVQLAYRDEGSGPPVVMIHGVGSALDSWDGVLDRLSPARRYIRFDLRGHGGSARTPGPYSLDDFVDDTVALMDQLAIDRAAIVGFSLGGLIAQGFALTHPERVCALALISTVAGRTAEEQARVEARADTLATEGAVGHLANAVDRWFTDEFRSAHPEILEARRRKSLLNDPDSYVAAYRVLAGTDLGSKLSSVVAPTLVMTGENDVGSTARMARFIHDRIDGSEIHILPGLKHSVLLEAPDQVANRLERFLAGRGQAAFGTGG